MGPRWDSRRPRWSTSRRGARRPSLRATPPCFRATQSVFEYGERRVLQAKGKSEPVAVYEALRVRQDVRDSEAPGPLGYGEPNILTPVSYGPDPANKRITTYFRKQVIVDHPDSVVGIGGYALFDDGFVIYLNGQRIGSDSMPSGSRK